MLISLSEINRYISESPWHSNTFGKLYVAPNSVKQPDKAFVSAAIKMQRRQGTNLTADEQKTIRKWQPKSTITVTQSNNVTAAHLVAQLSGNKAVNEKLKADEISVEFDDCFDHVIGSAAEVEQLWLIARYILITTCSTLAPILFEALLFLHANRTLWDERTV
jgi:hypothetical protein